MQDNPINPLLGAWRLLSVETQLDNGEVFHIFGKEPKGVIVYTPNGQMAAQVVNPDRPLVASGDQQQATDEEVRENFERYIAYYGTYEINEEKKSVIHHVDGSLFRNWEGDIQERFYEFRGNRIYLSTPPVKWGHLGEVISVLIWEKIL
jgi:hypothetical protein